MRRLEIKQMAVSTLNMAPYFTGYPFQGKRFSFYDQTRSSKIKVSADDEITRTGGESDGVRSFL